MVALLADIPRIGPTPVRRPTLRAVPSHYGQAVEGPAGRHLACRPNRTVLRRRRIVAVGLLAATTVGAWIGLQAALGRTGGGPLATTGAPGGLQSAAARVWVVRSGDTLWSIAEAVDPHGDVRPLVDRMAAQVGTTTLFPGEAIAIPAA